MYNVAKKIDRDIEFSCPFKKTKNIFPSGSEICTSIYVQHLSPFLWKKPNVIVFYFYFKLNQSNVYTNFFVSTV